ncbi:hypothetical protein B296_00056813 [Ensete ventricosum]|uniref:Uncharacterized protein n=1 Tax=Ensete ventricosum TaxID=4639 RepID=A0A426X243_ENSVE|nr:hypothetical protein B296_00056813 [Ensete ventricosum]
MLCRVAAAIIGLEGRELEGGWKWLGCISGVNGEPPLEFSPTSSLDLRTSFWTLSSRWWTQRTCSLRESAVSDDKVSKYETMAYTIPASAWTWLVRPRKASAVTTNDAGLDAGEGNPGSVIILRKRLGVGMATAASSVG